MEGLHLTEGSPPAVPFELRDGPLDVGGQEEKLGEVRTWLPLGGGHF